MLGVIHFNLSNFAFHASQKLRLRLYSLRQLLLCLLGYLSRSLDLVLYVGGDSPCNALDDRRIGLKQLVLHRGGC